MENIILGIFYISVTAYFLVSITISEVRDIMFYKKHKWDFSIDSQPKWKSYVGDSDKQTSNKERVIFSLPTTILCLIVQLFVLIYILTTEYI